MLFLNENALNDTESDPVTDTYTGDDTELLDIMVTHEQDMHNLTIAMMRAEHRSIMEGNTALYEEAEESFFKRVWNKIKEFWQKVVDFFRSLWEKISGLFRDREKVIKKNEEVIKKAVESRSIKMRLPENFAKWDSNKEVDAVNKNVKGIFLLTDIARRAKEMEGQKGFINFVKRNVFKLITKVEFENYNFAKYYEKKLGDPKEMTIDSSIEEVAKREAGAYHLGKKVIQSAKEAQKGAIDEIKRSVQTKNAEHRNAVMQAINVKSSMAATYTSALSNSIRRVSGLSWKVVNRLIKEGKNPGSGEGGGDSKDSGKEDKGSGKDSEKDDRFKPDLSDEGFKKFDKMMRSDEPLKF